MWRQMLPIPMREPDRRSWVGWRGRWWGGHRLRVRVEKHSVNFFCGSFEHDLVDLQGWVKPPLCLVLGPSMDVGLNVVKHPQEILLLVGDPVSLFLYLFKLRLAHCASLRWLSRFHVSCEWKHTGSSGGTCHEYRLIPTRRSVLLQRCCCWWQPKAPSILKQTHAMIIVIFYNVNGEHTLNRRWQIWKRLTYM